VQLTPLGEELHEQACSVFARVDATGVGQRAKTDSEKRMLLESATSKDLVLVA
jgi:DNA-binding transcriptional LysR family regulator